MKSNPHRPLGRPHARAFRSPACFQAAAAVLFTAFLAVSAVAQKRQATSPPNPKAFVGTWTASFEGLPFMTIRFTMKDGKLTGAMSNGEVTMDQNGNIKSVSVRPGVKPIEIQQVKHNAVYLRHGGKNDPLRFAFRLTDKTHAQLQILAPSPAGIIVPKPILLVKQTKKH